MTRARVLALRLPLVSGVCRWCRCTDDRGCEAGCSWVDRAHTLCSECGVLDGLVRTVAGRKALAVALQNYGGEALLTDAVAALPAARSRRR